MPYAINGTISQDQIDGGIEITQEQYAHALEGMLWGKLVSIDSGFAVIDRPEPVEPELPEPNPIPQSISKAQGQAQLAIEGKHQAVLDYIAAIPDPTQRLLAEIAFNATNDWMLDSPFLNQAATDLGWMENPEYLNEFFVNASKIKL